MPGFYKARKGGDGVAPDGTATGRATGTMIHKKGGKTQDGYPVDKATQPANFKGPGSKAIAAQPGMGKTRAPKDRMWGGV